MSGPKKSWDELGWGDITVNKVRHFDWKDPEGLAILLNLSVFGYLVGLVMAGSPGIL